MRDFRPTPLDNVKVKHKMLLVYVACIMVPILAIMAVFYTRVAQDLRTREVSRLTLSMERIRDGLAKSLQEVIAVSTVLYTDGTLNDAMERTYKDGAEVNEAYVDYLRDVIPKYVATYDQIQSIRILHDNPSLGNAGEFARIDAKVLQTDWYRKMKENAGALSVNAGLEAGSFFPFDGQRSLIVARSLDYFKNTNRNARVKILKITLRLASVDALFKGEKLEGRLFLVDERDRIVYTNVEGMNYAAEDLLWSSYAEGEADIFIRKDFNASGYLQGWKVVGQFSNELYMAQLRESRNFLLLLLATTLLLATGFILVIFRSMSTRLSLVTRHIGKFKSKDFMEVEMPETFDEIGELIHEYNVMVVTIRKLLHDVVEEGVKNQKLEVEKKQAQINALQSQINPHFLFNTLESIKMRCLLKDEQQTADMINNLSRNFRRMISWGDDMVSVSEEIDFLEAYIRLQQYRYNDKFTCIIEADADCRSQPIPKLTLQPLVENAIEHGIAKKKGSGVIRVYVGVIRESIYCKVEDTGAGMSAGQLDAIRNGMVSPDGGDTGSIGLHNVFMRLRLLYGDQLDFRPDSQPGEGTKVYFSFPMGRAASGDGRTRLNGETPS